MKRNNSRNNSSSNRGGPDYYDQKNLQNQRFNHTSNPQQSKMPQGISRQVPLSDLYKASTQQREEIHQLMGEIEMPDESLTISSMSQSPFQGKIRQNLSNTNGTQENSNDNDGTLGRSELEAFNSTNNEKSQISKSLNFRNQGYGNNTTQSYLDDEDDSHHDANDSHEDNGYINQRRRQTNEITNNDLSLDVTENNDHLSQNDGGRDSPYFNKHAITNGNSTVDLTISQTVISNTNTTHRMLDNVNTQNTKRSSNRTFADSVLNHQYNQYTSSSNNNSHRNQYNFGNQNSNLESNRQMLRRNKNDEATLISSNEKGESEEDEDEEDEDDGQICEDISKEDIDPSDQSAIESFTNHSKYTTSRMGLSRFTARGGASNPYNDEYSSKRSPVMQRRDDGESSSLSPSPIQNDHQWLSQTRSFIHNKATNRTAGSDNPMNKLTTNLPQILNNQLNNRTQTALNGKHNRSLQQRDPELEQALEEDSQNQTLQRFNTLEESKENPHEQLRSHQSKSQNVGYKYSKLKIKYQSLEGQLSQLANECEQKDNELNIMRNECLKMQDQLQDKDEHIVYLQQKFKDDSALPQLRTKNLNLAKNEIQKLTLEIQQKDNLIQQLEQEIRKRQTDDQIYEMATQQEIAKLNQELDTLRILSKGKQRDADSTVQKYIQKMAEQESLFKKQIEQQQSVFSEQLRDRDNQINQLDKAFKELKKLLKTKEQDMLVKDNELKDVLQQLSDLGDVLDQKEKLITQTEQAKDKYLNEMKNFKERCKQLETELEQTKGFENNSMFMNSMSYQNVTNNQSKKNDYELKQIKEVYEKKLTKALEEASQKTSKIKDLEIELKNTKEEHKKLKEIQISSTSEKFEKDKEIINELKEAKVEISTFKQMEEDIRICFNMQPREDIVSKLTSVCQDLETIPLLERELEKLKNKLEESQKQIIDLNSKKTQDPNNGQISNFMKNILFQKDQQLEDAQRNYETEREAKVKLQEEVFALSYQITQLTTINSDLHYQLTNLQNELAKTKESNQKLDRNVDELKEKMRVMIREQQELNQSQLKFSKEAMNDDGLRKKYEEIIEVVLSLNLAEDPLQSANISLQESFIDECEQAKKHITEQVKLVNDHMARVEKEKLGLIEEIEKLEKESKEKVLQIESIRKELNKVNDSIKEKDRKVEVISLENREISERIERLLEQQKLSEEQNLKLRQELDQANINLRKVMRTQEHLHKDNKKLNTSKVVTQQSNEDVERIQMAYEDGMSKMMGAKENKNQMTDEEIIQMRELYRNEVLEMFDRLIDSNTKMPTFNDLAIQLSSRIDRLLSQHQLAFHSQLKQSSDDDKKQQMHSLKSSKNEGGSDNHLVETFKQEMDSINNEDELVQSIAKWMKQSHNQFNQNPSVQHKNFFQNEDNNSLMFSELVVAQQQQQQNNQKQLQEQNHEQAVIIQEKQTLIDQLTNQLSQLEQDIEMKDKTLEELKELLQELEAQHKRLIEEVRNKDSLLRESEEQFSLKNKQFDDESKLRNQQMWREVESLKEQIRQELISKSAKLDQEFEDMQSQKQKLRDQYSQQQAEMELKYQQKLDIQEKEFVNKLKQMESDIKFNHEKSKDELLSNVYKQLEDQYESKIKNLQEDHQTQISNLKQEYNSKIDDLKKSKEREAKKQKEETDRIKKTFDDKIKKLEMEFQSEKDSMEREFAQKIETLNQKQKKDQKSAQDKAKADTRNQVDNIKNEMQKQKIDMDREKKKLVQEHQNALELQSREFEEKLEQEIKQLNVQWETKTKKRIEEKEKQCAKRLSDMEAEFGKLQSITEENSVKDRERLEILLRESLRNEIRSEIEEKMEKEYRQQMETVQKQYLKEFERIKERYEQTERVITPPIVITDSRDAMIQCVLVDDAQSQNWEKESSRSMQSRTQNEGSMISIGEMRERFEEEMDRQKEIFEVQLVTKQNISVRIFEEILTLEFDKILQSIYHKSQQSNNQKSNLDQKRKEINTLINDILNRNDDRKEKQMKSSLDNLKKKISEVLQVFKTELENKLNKKLHQEMEEMKRDLQQEKNQSYQQIKQGGLVLNEQNLREKLKLQNLSEIVSKDDDNSSEYASNPTGGQITSQNNSRLPTPRNINMSARSVSNSGQKQINSSHMYSDIKKYTSEEQQEEINNQLLRKITPIPNAKGVLVVEVEKVVRDLKMLFQTIKSAKFYRLLISIDELNQHANTGQEGGVIDEERGCQNNDISLQIYRQLLNDLFKCVVKLNNGAEQIGKQSETYKLKLINAELREKLQKYEHEISLTKSTELIESILNHYNQQRQNSQLSQDSKMCLQSLENTQFVINKNQFKLYQLIDLFTITDNLNVNALEVNSNCKSYVEQNPAHELIQNDQLLQSQCSPDKMRIQPEMLSPEETAQLVANVFSKLNQTTNQYNQTNNQQFDMFSSFFQTFLSNEDYIKNAENFIQKYREQLSYTQKYKNLPLQLNREAFNKTNATQKPYQSVQVNNNIKQKRCKSQTNTNQSCQYPLQQQNNHYTSQVSNVFQSNLMEKNSVNSYNPILINNYDTQSQNSQVNNSYISQNSKTMTANPMGKANMPYQSIHNRNMGQTDEVSSAQSNMNMLFERIKNNFLSGFGERKQSQ